MKSYNIYLLMAAITCTLSVQAIDYRVVNSTGKPVTVQLNSAFRDEAITVPAGGIRTKSTMAANCIDTIYNLTDGNNNYIGGAICAGSVVCIRDNGNGPEATAFPWEPRGFNAVLGAGTALAASLYASGCRGTAEGGIPVAVDTWQNNENYN